MTQTTKSSNNYSDNWYKLQIFNTVKDKLLAIAVLVVLVTHVAFYLLLETNLELFAWLNVEDGVFEYGTSMLLFFSGVCFFLGAIPTNNNLQRFWAISFGVILIFMAGEEVSWGQRLLGFNVEFIQESNSQNEVNLHNMPFMRTTRLLSIASILLGAIVPVVLLTSSRARRLFRNQLQIPLPHPVASLCFVLSYAWYRLFHDGPADGDRALSVEESREFTIGFACLLYALIWYKTLGCEDK